MIYIMNFLYFILYSFLGWVYESTLCSIINSHKIINRGFLLGPYCPIYGIGVVLNLLLLKNVENPLIILGASALLSCVIEYVTSFIMEKLFYARWWDYSKFPFNLHGRICLYGAIVFGIGNLIFIKIIHPFVMSIMENIPRSFSGILALGLVIILSIDIILTVNCMNDLNKNLKIIHETISIKVDNTMEILNDKINILDDSMVFEKGKGIIIKMQNANNLIKSKELRIIKAFPNMHSLKYETIINRIYQKIAVSNTNRVVNSQNINNLDDQTKESSENK